MAIHKKDILSEEEQELALLAKALYHPARVAILAQSTVSQHLKALLSAGLIQGTVEGVRSCYCINRDTIRRFEKSMKTLFSLAVKGDCC